MSESKTKSCSVMIDGNGNAVPTKYVSAYDKMRDKHVRRIVNAARKIRTDLENFIRLSISEMEEVRGTKDAAKLGVKGNFEARSFDGLLCVKIRQNYNVTMDERVQSAREKMLSYISRVLGRVNANDAQALHAIVSEAFHVGANGMLSHGKVLALLRMEISDSEWKEAQKLLREALGGVRGKQYLQIFSRPDHNHDFKQILLDAADCWPTIDELEKKGELK